MHHFKSSTGVQQRAYVWMASKEKKHTSVTPIPPLPSSCDGITSKHDGWSNASNSSYARIARAAVSAGAGDGIE
jgi:hypothetical protein